jgi:hypothetical protein
VGVEILTMLMSHHDGLEGAVVSARGPLANAERLEEDLGGTRTFVAW